MTNLRLSDSQKTYMHDPKRGTEIEKRAVIIALTVLFLAGTLFWVWLSRFIYQEHCNPCADDFFSALWTGGSVRVSAQLGLAILSVVTTALALRYAMRNKLMRWRLAFSATCALFVIWLILTQNL